MGVLSNLEPSSVWRHFENLCNIPRPSGHEEAVAQYVVEQAEKHSLQVQRDEIGNVVVTRAASSNCETAKKLAFQSHLDMVTVASEGVTYDFLKQGIVPQVVGENVCATDTTLGADNGMGVALMLALMEEQREWGQVEFLFTINEEDGMDGARELDPSMLTADYFINLDSEEWGEFYISSAGGGDSTVCLPLERAEQSQSSSVVISVSGLKGGHSGCDIHLGRGGAIQIIARVLHRINCEYPLALQKIEGGNKRNAIPDRAKAWLKINPDNLAEIQKLIEQMSSEIATELANVDPDVTVTLSEEGSDEIPCTAECTSKVLELLYSLPHGVLAMSQEVAGLVETSSNLAIVATEDHQLTIKMSSRSAVDSAFHATRQRISAMAALAGASISFGISYPGWKPQMDSKILEITQQAYHELFSEKPIVKAIHAGLECGYLAAKFPNAEVVSLGPDIRYPHTPREEVGIPSVQKCYELLRQILDKVAS